MKFLGFVGLVLSAVVTGACYFTGMVFLSVVAGNAVQTHAPVLASPLSLVALVLVLVIAIVALISVIYSAAKAMRD